MARKPKTPVPATEIPREQRLLQEVDSRALRTTSEILDEHDRHRALLEVPDPKE